MSFATPGGFTLCFVLIDQTTGDRPDLAPFLPSLASALVEQLNGPFLSFHGGSYTVRVASSPTDRAPGEVAVNIRHATATDPSGALGWHQVTNGVEDIELPLDAMSGLTGDGQALDVVASHEVLETACDPGANLWADNGNGKVSAREACDRVEDGFYAASNGLNVSNFLLPSAWVPGAPGPWDYMMVLPGQLDAAGQVTMTPGGYDIEATAPSDEQDVTPQMRMTSVAHALLMAKGVAAGGWRARKSSRYSRTSRRGVTWAPAE